MNYQPVYAPALVAFIGGPNFGVSISFGGGGGGDVGWFPLGPREVYVPGYNTSRGYVDRVNTSNTNVSNTTITNVYNKQVTNINNNNKSRTNITYVNRDVPGAVTAVPQNAFRSSAPVARVAVPVNEKQIASAPVMSRAVVAPTRDSVLGTFGSYCQSCGSPARSSCQSSGGGKNKSASASRAFCQTTAGTGKAPRPAVGCARSAGSASGKHRGNTTLWSSKRHQVNPRL